MSDIGVACIWFIGLLVITGSIRFAVYATLLTAIAVVAVSDTELALRIVLFTVGVMLIHFGLYLHAIIKRVERNLRSVPTCSKSVPDGHPVRLEIERDRRRAIQHGLGIF